MTITRWAPERLRAFDRFNNMMEEMFSSMTDEYRGIWSPIVDVKETKTEYIFTAELPGVLQKDINVELTGDVLTISGNREFSKTENREDYVRIERSFGTFSRSFSLDTPVKADKINANCKEGILTIVLPKSEAALPKKITIKPA